MSRLAAILILSVSTIVAGCGEGTAPPPPPQQPVASSPEPTTKAKNAKTASPSKKVSTKLAD